MRTILGMVLLTVFALTALLAVSVETQAASSKTLPNFEMRGLDESEHRLSDEKYKDKVVLVAGFSTWQDISIKQARELQAFHLKHPNVEIVAFVSDDAAAARDFGHVRLTLCQALLWASSPHKMRQLPLGILPNIRSQDR